MFSMYLFVSNFDRFCFRACDNYHPIVFSEECKRVVKKEMPECFTEDIYISCNSHREDSQKKNSNEQNFYYEDFKDKSSVQNVLIFIFKAL